MAEHALIDMSTPADDTALWCACECGWFAGPFEDELFAAEAYADHKLDRVANWVVAREQDVTRLKLLLVDAAEFLECIDFYEEGRTPPISLDDLAARLRKELEG